MKVTKIEAMPQSVRRKRVCAYARVSNSKDAMRHSLSAQISHYNELINRRIEWEFAGVYADDPVSGTTERRPEFQRMLEDCRAGKIDMIITKSVTRFARNVVTTLESIRELKQLNIDVFFEKENIHSMSGDGELMLTALAIYAQAESFSASENCKWRIQKMFQQGLPNSCTMLGYRLKDGKPSVVPEEADIVKQIFSDYLSGMGIIAIAKKLITEGVPNRIGGMWRMETIGNVLINEKYTGDLLLQKTYKQDHITKKKCFNNGQRPKYFVKDNHEPIISREIFNQVQLEIKKRQAKYAPKSSASETYPFSRMITCEKCGKHYRRKHASAGSKYEKIVWICETFNTLGKASCDSQQIPETILIAKTTEVLELSEFDENVLKGKVAEIRVPAPGKLVFIFRDGLQVECEWKNPSRAESWTPEMKQKAREQMLKIRKERRAKNGN